MLSVLRLVRKNDIPVYRKFGVVAYRFARP
jgi:hypothetical protein